METRRGRKRSLEAERDTMEAKRQKVTNSSQYYLVTRARTIDEEAAIKSSKNHKEAAHKSWYTTSSENPEEARKLKLNKGDSIMRKFAILYQYIYVHGAPQKEQIEDPCDHTINCIMKTLAIPRGSRQSVKTVILNYIRDGDSYNPSVGEEARGRPAVIDPKSMDACLLFNCLETGLSIGESTQFLNSFRLKSGLPEISWPSVHRFVTRNPSILTTKTEVKKSGNNNPNSMWAKFRLSQCEQFRNQLLAKIITLDGIAWWDEHHRKCVLGSALKLERRVCRDETGNISTVEAGGSFPDKKMRTSVKFEKEARGLYGVAMVTKLDGTKEARRAEPLCYNEKKVVGLAEFRRHMETEKERVRNMGGIWSGGGGYEEKYGDQADQKVKEKLRDSDNLIPVTDFMDHVVRESKKMFAGTTAESTFRIYHDALSAWFEKDAQAYLEQLGFKDRQIRCEGNTNKGTRYAGKLVGNSPEMSRALDSHGLSDYKRTVSYNIQVSNALPDTQRDKQFRDGTPNELWHSMARCWQISPPAHRIIEDIEEFPAVLDKIIEARGCVVPDEDFRTGRRATRLDGNGKCKRNLQSARRRGSLESIALHPDLIDAAGNIEVLAYQDYLKLNHTGDDHDSDSDSDSYDEE